MIEKIRIVLTAKKTPQNAVLKPEGKERAAAAICKDTAASPKQEVQAV